MRELIDILDKILTESLVDEAANLAPGELLSRAGRFEKFIDHIRNQRPFYTTDDQEVIVDPSEADRFIDMHDQGIFTGPVKARDISGQEWPLSKFKKTAEFGGSGVKPGEKGDVSKMSKDAAKLKPSDIGITNKDMSADELGPAIVNNPNLQSSLWGQAVIEMANSIMAGEPAVIPEDVRKYDPIVKAIVDNAGEYLGVLALVSGQSSWYGGAATKKAFVKWLGADVDGLTVNFPSSQTTALADSYATISNASTGHTLNISSKGTGGGAAPALSTLKIPDSVRRNQKYSKAVELIDMCANESAALVGFRVMNLLFEDNPKEILKEYKGLLPWSDAAITAAIDSLKSKKPMPAKYQKIINSVDSAATDGGKLMYAVKRDVAKMVNSGIMPEYEAALLEVLDYNFIQQYATFEGKKSGVVSFSTQWPAKIDGEISMENKSSAPSPGSGGFSFKLHPKGTPMRIDPETGDVNDSKIEKNKSTNIARTATSDLDAVSQRRSKIKASTKSVEPADTSAFGRKKRR